MVQETGSKRTGPELCGSGFDGGHRGSDLLDQMDHAMVVSKRRAVIGGAVRHVVDVPGVPDWDYYRALHNACIDGIRKEVPFDA